MAVYLRAERATAKSRRDAERAYFRLKLGMRAAGQELQTDTSKTFITSAMESMSLAMTAEINARHQRRSEVEALADLMGLA
jgi:hypothetical protein